MKAGGSLAHFVFSEGLVSDWGIHELRDDPQFREDRSRNASRTLPFPTNR
jgi:hypothetical protein